MIMEKNNPCTHLTTFSHCISFSFVQLLRNSSSPPRRCASLAPVAGSILAALVVVVVVASAGRSNGRPLSSRESVFVGNNSIILYFSAGNSLSSVGWSEGVSFGNRWGGWKEGDSRSPTLEGDEARSATTAWSRWRHGQRVHWQIKGFSERRNCIEMKKVAKRACPRTQFFSSMEWRGDVFIVHWYLVKRREKTSQKSYPQAQLTSSWFPRIKSSSHLGLTFLSVRWTGTSKMFISSP